MTTAIVVLAESKGWESITVKGHKEFKRQVWREATKRGIEVSGYEPDKQDLAALDAKQNDRQSNTVEKTPAREDAQVKSATGREYRGTVVAHGVAPYKNDKGNNVSYFLTLDTDKGRETVWGKDLELGISESGVKSGDQIRVRNTGSQPVTVNAPVRDVEGKVIGNEPIATNRNTRKVTRSDQRQVADAVASELIESKVADPKDRQKLKAGIAARLDHEERAGPLPTVKVYDNAAPTPRTKQPERSQECEEELSR